MGKLADFFHYVRAQTDTPLGTRPVGVASVERPRSPSAAACLLQQPFSHRYVGCAVCLSLCLCFLFSPCAARARRRLRRSCAFAMCACPSFI
jgi:hypothetical protein